MDTATLIGTLRTSYELHSFHGEFWLVVRTASDAREIEELAQTLMERGDVEGVRIARRLEYVDHGYTAVTIIAKRLRPGVLEADPLQVANPGRDASWCEKPEDFAGDQQRQVIRAFFAKYLDEKRLTPLEVLHYEVHAKALDQAGTTVQGALQRIASQQVRGTKQSAVSRLKELMALEEEGLRRLTAAAKDNPPVTVAPRGLGALAASLASGGGDPAPALYRGIAKYLADAKTWLEKLNRLFLLFEPDLSVREVRLLDGIAAEILASAHALKELSGEGKTRFDLVTNLVDLYSGTLGKEADTGFQKGSWPPGVLAMSKLLADGVLPRALGELRHGILRHLVARIPLRGTGGLTDEIQAAKDLRAHMAARAPTLVRDEEILDALAIRVDRQIQPESMAELLNPARTCTTKIEVILALVEQVPGEAPKAKLAPYLRSLMSPEEMIRDAGAMAARAGAIGPIAGIARRIAESGIPDPQRAELVQILDTALFEMIRADLMGNQSVPFADRILHLIRNAGALPEGRARQLARDTLTLALKRPEFILNYLERFRAPAEKRQAYLRLRQELLDCGLVDKALVPAAA